jgi:hypothetical protein
MFSNPRWRVRFLKDSAARNIPGAARSAARPFRETATDYLRRSSVAPIRRHVPPALDPLKVALDEYNEIMATLRTVRAAS